MFWPKFWAAARIASAVIIIGCLTFLLSKNGAYFLAWLMTPVGIVVGQSLAEYDYDIWN